MAKTAVKEEPIPPDIQAMSFEQALRALDQIVHRLETGNVELEESIDIYSRGALLRRHCEAKLKAAGEKVEKIVIGSNGTVVGSEPAEVE